MIFLVKIGGGLRSDMTIDHYSTRIVWQTHWLTDSQTHKVIFIMCPMLLMHWADKNFHSCLKNDPSPRPQHAWMCQCNKADKLWAIDFMLFFTDLGVLCRWPPKRPYRQWYTPPWSMSDKRCRTDIKAFFIIDRPRSGVVYNFGRLSVCLCVCQTITFESLDVGSSYLHTHCTSRLHGIRVEFIYGHRVKVKVRSQKGCNAYSCNVKLQSAITPLL